LQFIMCSTK